MKCYHFYQLSEPGNIDDIRYVGMTNQTLEKRLEQHIRRVKSGKENNPYKRAWIEGLLEYGLLPEISLIHEACYEHPYRARLHELYLILQCIEMQIDLTNMENHDARKWR